MAKYDAEARSRMAKSGAAMPDGSYPIADREDLANAIRAVGRGNAPNNAIRRHILKRAKALGLMDLIPDTWNADGSLNRSEAEPAALFLRAYPLEDIRIMSRAQGL